MSEEHPTQGADSQDGAPRWQIVEIVPLSPSEPRAPEHAEAPGGAGAANHASEQPAPGTPASETAAERPIRRTSPPSRPLWGELDALLRMPSPPVAPAIAVIDEARQRELRRRRSIRRLRRMSLAAVVGVALGVAAWLWGPVGWLHPLSIHFGPFHAGALAPLQRSGTLGRSG
jgi:hypothetical protein